MQYYTADGKKLNIVDLYKLPPLNNPASSTSVKIENNNMDEKKNEKIEEVITGHDNSAFIVEKL